MVKSLLNDKINFPATARESEHGSWTEIYDRMLFAAAFGFEGIYEALLQFILGSRVHFRHDPGAGVSQVCLPPPFTPDEKPCLKNGKESPQYFHTPLSPTFFPVF